MTFGVVWLVCVVFFRAGGELLEKPDDNTLWVENGKNISVAAARAADAWSGGLKFAPLPDGGGFSVESPSFEQNKSFRYVPISAEYPWFVFEITGIEQKPGYVGWSFPHISGLKTFSQVNNPRKGYYALNVFEGAPGTNGARAAALYLYLYDLKLDLKYLKMVKIPDYCVEVTSAAFCAKKNFAPGDELKFTTRLKEPAEDVSLRFYDSNGMRQLTLNGHDKLQLKPEDESAKVWSAALMLESIGCADDKEIKADGIIVKATILGGAFNEPVWGAINYPFNSIKSGFEGKMDAEWQLKTTKERSKSW